MTKHNEHAFEANKEGKFMIEKNWIPACAGITVRVWIPAYAGMTVGFGIPAYAGMT